MSRPRSRSRLCFWKDIPPTIAAMLTCGGGLVVFRESLVSALSAASVILYSNEVMIALRCEETCSANSRVGARIRAFSERLCDEDGRGWESKSFKIGRP